MRIVAGANWREWLRQAWPLRKQAVVQSFLSIGAEHKLFLAELALRGNAFTPIHERDPVEAHRAEGRRQLALETLAICNVDPMALWALIETKPRE